MMYLQGMGARRGLQAGRHTVERWEELLQFISQPKLVWTGTFGMFLILCKIWNYCIYFLIIVKTGVKTTMGYLEVKIYNIKDPHCHIQLIQKRKGERKKFVEHIYTNHHTYQLWKLGFRELLIRTMTNIIMTLLLNNSFSCSSPNEKVRKRQRNGLY